MTAANIGFTIIAKDLVMRKPKVGTKWQTELVFTVRSCNQIAKQFIDCIGPLQEQVDSNTRRIEELKKKLEAQQKDTELEVNRAISEVNSTR